MKLTTSQIVKLLSIPGVGRAKVFKLADVISFSPHDDGELADALTEQMPSLKIPFVPRAEILTCFGHAGELLYQSEQKGIKTVSYFESAFPKLLKDIDNPPIILNILGNINSLEMPTAAVIGTRAPSDYGKSVGERIGYRLGERKIHVVSGLAIGCDTTAHVGCIKARGITSAVLAHGLDSVYPKENKLLANRILESNGCLISEYMIKVRAMGNFFVERDRIQAGLSKATIVIETDVKGGTMHTVKDTLQYRRILAAVEHPDDKRNEKSRGNEMLIRERKALPLTSKEDIDALVNLIAPTQQKASLGSETKTSLDEIQLPLYSGEDFTTMATPKEKVKKPRKKRTKPGVIQSKAFKDESNL